ncbi:peptidase M10A and M12B matrixin and adamalysin [Arthrobacter sp. R4-81]
MTHWGTRLIAFFAATVMFISVGVFLYGGFRPLTLLGLGSGSSGWAPMMGQRSAPTPGLDEGPEPLGAPAPLTELSSSYVFLHSNEGTPVSYSPCRPIHYVVNAEAAPPGSGPLIEAAVRRISEASGFRFVFDGHVDERPALDRSSFQPDRYGNMWAPVLISWTDPETVPQLSGDTVGVGGSTRVKHSSGHVGYVSGQVSLDAPQVRKIIRTTGGSARAIAIILHELAHVLGLGHVPDPSQLMFEHGTPLRDFGPGDLTGLARLAEAPCTRML